MKICLVSNTLPGFHQSWSGAEIFCWRLGQMLQKEEHDVSFITTQFGKKVAHQEQIYQVPHPPGGISVLLRNFPTDVLGLFSSLIALKKLKPDIVHLHTHVLFLPVLMSALILKIPVVLTVLDYFIVCPINILVKPDGEVCTSFHGAHCAHCVSRFKLLPTWLRKLLLHYRAMVFKKFVSKLDAVIVLSQTSKARLEQYGLPGDKIKVIYHYQLVAKSVGTGISTGNSRTPVILFVGSLHKHKGLHIIIEAMSHVINQIPNARLIVVGTSKDEQYKARIRDMVDRFRLEKHVEFLGHRENEEVLQLVSQGDVVVVSEQWPNDFGPIILVEVKALGKPIVASRIGGIPEFIRDGVDGFCVTHNQPEEFAQKITWVLQHKNEAQAIGEKARQSTAFLFNEPAKRIINEYRSVIALKKSEER